MPSRLGESLLHDAFPTEKAKSSIALVVARRGRPLQGPDYQWASRLYELCDREKDNLPVLEVWNHDTEIVGEKLISKPTKQQPGQATVILMLVGNEFAQFDNIRLLQRVKGLLAEAKSKNPLPEGLEVGITGSAALGGDFLMSSEESIKNTEATTIVLVVCILLAVYRAPVLVALPLVTIGLSLLVSVDVLALLTQGLSLAGFRLVELQDLHYHQDLHHRDLVWRRHGLLLVPDLRFKEEMDRGLAARAAVAESVTQVGEALVGSAMTTICGLGMLFFSDFGKFRNSGPAIAICLAITLLACLTFAPALLTLAGNALFWPFASRRARNVAEQGSVGEKRRALLGNFWQWVGDAVIAHPGLILVVSILALAPLAREGWSIKVTYDLVNELDQHRTSVEGVMLSQEFFPPGETSPVTILALQKDGKFNTPAGEREILNLTKSLYDISGVVKCAQSG